MDYSCRLCSLGNSSTAPGRSDSGGKIGPGYSLCHPEFFFFVSTLLLSIFTLFCLPSSSVSLSYFYLGVPMRKYLGEHSSMSSTFSIAILNNKTAVSYGNEVLLN